MKWIYGLHTLQIAQGIELLNLVVDLPPCFQPFFISVAAAIICGFPSDSEEDIFWRTSKLQLQMLNGVHPHMSISLHNVHNLGMKRMEKNQQVVWISPIWKIFWIFWRFSLKNVNSRYSFFSSLFENSPKMEFSWWIMIIRDYLCNESEVIPSKHGHWDPPCFFFFQAGTTPHPRQGGAAEAARHRRRVVGDGTSGAQPALRLAGSEAWPIPHRQPHFKPRHRDQWSRCCAHILSFDL